MHSWAKATCEPGAARSTAAPTGRRVPRRSGGRRPARPPTPRSRGWRERALVGRRADPAPRGLRHGAATRRGPRARRAVADYAQGRHEIGPVAAGGRYAGAANGDADLVFALTLLDLPERRGVVEQILRARRSGTPP